jgi:hypothetical protein
MECHIFATRTIPTRQTRKAKNFLHFLQLSLWLVVLSILTPMGAQAQMAGYGAILGTVTDASGAVIPGASVTANLVAQNSNTVRSTTGTGNYNITPLTPGIYTVTVAAKGFETYVQENITVNALENVPLNIKLNVGSAEQTITVTDAPPVLETADATLGAVMDNEMYSNLPLLMGAGGNADQRRATDFAALMPGVQNTYSASSASGGSNSTDASGGVNGSNPGGGTSEIYIDGINLPSSLGNGDPRPTWTAFGMDSIDQFQSQTSGYSSQYAGQGVQNYSIKQGGNQFHGSVYEYTRNKFLDAWATNNKLPTAVGVVPSGSSCSSATLSADTSWCKLGGVKPQEVMNEVGIVLSGPIIKNKLFLFYNYGQYRYQKGASPTVQTLPTLNMMGYDSNGNSLGYADYTGYQKSLVSGTTSPAAIYDPATQTEAGCSTNCTRTAFANDQIPQARFSQAATYINQYVKSLEGITNQSMYANNVATGVKIGLSNWYQTGRLDYAANTNHQVSLIVAFGRQSTTGTNAGGTLPPPFNTTQTYHPDTNVDILKETWTINPHMVNSVAVAFSRYQSTSLTPNDAEEYSTANTGILNMPAGQASYFPKIAWSGSNLPGTWGGYSAHSVASNTYTVVDNLQWELGKHSLTLGGQFVAVEYNSHSPLTYSGPMSFTFSSAQTYGYDTSTHKALSNSGAAYASYMLGAVSSSSVTVGNPELGPRWHDPSFWVQDNYKVTPKLTLNLGLRWDIWPSIHENHNNFTWLNPTALNPVTGNRGALAFAGGNPQDGWHTGRSNPSDMWWKNVAPRLGLAYALNSKTVLRASYGLSFARGGWASGNSQSGSPSTTGLLPSASAAPVTGSNQPSFYWDQTACGSGTLAGDGLTSCGWTGSLSSPTSVLPSGSTLAGYGAVETVAQGAKNTATLYSWDPYYGSRVPEYINWTFGVERQLNKDTSISINYVGSEGHFIKTGSTTGTYMNNKLQESYASMAGYSLASSTGTTYSACSGATCIYPLLTQKVNVNSTNGLAVAQGLGYIPQNPYNTSYATYYQSNSVYGYYAPFPQYSGVSNTTSFVGNENYHALQVVVKQRPAHGLNWMVNYTFSKSIDDLGTFRVYDNPRLDRSLSAADQPHSLTATAVWHLPVGKGHMFGDNFVYRSLTSNWLLSGIGTARSGLPIIVTGSGCGGAGILNQCMPNLVQGQKGRQYKWGKSASGHTASWDSNSSNYIGSVNYVNPSAFTVNIQGTTTGTGAYGTYNGQAYSVGGGPNLYTPGNVSRVAPLNMFSQKNIDVDMALKRTFPIYHDMKLAFEADMSNVANHPLYGTPSCTVQSGSTSTFCTVSSMAPNYNPREVQLAGRISW